MIFTVPVVYEAKIIRPRCRNEERVLCGEWVEVHVAEVSDIDAPVALRWTDKYARDSVNGIKETRWYDDRHFEPSAYHASGQDSEHLDMERLERMCLSGVHYANPLTSGHDWQIRECANGKYKPISELEARTVISCERESAIQKAYAKAAETLIVDGMIWTARDEPVYRVARSGGFHDDYVFLDVVGTESMSDKQQHGVFRADRFDDACEYANGLTANPGNMIDRRIDVFIPESVTYDDETPAFLEAAEDAIKWHKDRLGDQGRPQIEAWLDLRDAYEAAVGEADAEHLLSLERALVVYRDVALDRWPQERLDRALQRWSMRPMVLDLGQGYAPGR